MTPPPIRLLIGQNGATDDTVTIAGNVSITDDDWAISATGVGTNLTASDLSCTDCIGPTEITDLTLGTDTAGNYVAGATANAGLTMSGTEGGTLGISLQANKGLEVDTNGLSLIDCGDTQVLKYSTGTNQWSCQADATGGVPSWDTLGDPATSSTMGHGQFSTSFDWDMGSDTALSAFSFTILNDLVTDSTSQKLLSLRNLNDGLTTGLTDVLLYLNNADANEAVTTAIQIDDTGGGGYTNLFDVAGTLISPAEFTALDGGITLGTETNGNYVAGATANAGLTMSGTEGGTLGISLQANKGLEVDTNGLSLIDCGDTQVLKYSTGTNQWSCQADATGGVPSWDTLGDPATSSTMGHGQFSTSFDWDMGSDTALSAFSFTILNDLVTDSTSQKLLSLRNLNDGLTTGLTDVLLYLNNADANEAVTTAIQIDDTGGGGYTNLLDTPSLDISGAGAITGATGLTVAGTSNLQGDVLDTSGNLTLNDTVDISGALTVTGDLTVNGTGTHTFAGTLDPNNVAPSTSPGM